MSGEESETIKAKHSLYLLSQLNDIQIIWLQYYFLKYSSRRAEFESTHFNTLKKLHSFTSASEQENSNYAIQKSYIDHLKHLDLIIYEIEVDSKTKLPRFDRNGNQKIRSTKVTILGKYILKLIGIVDSLSYAGD